MKQRLIILTLLTALAGWGLTIFAFHQANTSVYDKASPEFLQVDTSTTIENIKSNKAGLYYFGFESCPWCQDLLPQLQEELRNSSSKAYLVNTKSKAFTPEAKKIVTSIYKEHLGGDKLYVPFLVAINRKGQVRVHMGTVKGHDASSEEMSSEQLKELKNILSSLNEFSRS
ncbi:TPA: transporter accessory protein [Streptococcus suis]|uniref:transporter accessory protein n=1 Tax=Streptococcus suis TaxID=1307 RepID=UPI0004626B91|nr:transporter accessory protein [Streptococcus suis]MCK3965273.1 transporter accessory protein [Streptococcus suis]HEL1708519.1 transporter accessory protein [Streptococcus suis]HEL1776824.1 transporter accessory protein [Streptococcus suis]HEL1838118.1 transporter accessory protein [Streptococcus suis]HEL2005443.1 transporter accessory protein [Streptococcus suis]